MRSRRGTFFSLLAALTVTLAACSGGDDSTDVAASPAPVDIRPVAGCEQGWTDPADLSEDRKPARCEPNAPAPVPLTEKTKVVVTAATLNAEFISPIRLALAKGEFEKENLEVELRQVPAADGLNLLAQGESDAFVGSPDAAFFNAVNSGFDLRWVMGNFDPPPESKSGIWARSVDGRAPTMADLDGEQLASVLGTGSPIMYPIVQAWEKAGLDVKDLKFQTLPAADIVTALQNGAIKGAWVLDPLWTRLEGDPNLHFVTGPVLGEPIGGVMFGKNLLGGKRSAGEAFVRAVVRTVNTYFADDYKQDEAFIQELSEVLDLPTEQLGQTPSLIMDWEIRAGTADRIQDALIKLGSVGYSEPKPESEVVDRSFYQVAVGHRG